MPIYMYFTFLVARIFRIFGSLFLWYWDRTKCRATLHNGLGSVRRLMGNVYYHEFILLIFPPFERFTGSSDRTAAIERRWRL